MKVFWGTMAFVVLVSSVLGCTIGVFSPLATADDRPMLWKNRDVPNVAQQYIYVEAEHNFVAITYQGVYDKVYGGTNDAGFGIVNTDTYNQGNWRSYGISDGEVMFIALSQCESVWDFLGILDSLLADTSVGLRSTHCYGVIDKFGNAIVVEATCTNYVYFNAASAPYGFLVRTNFAISGDDTLRRGWDRYIRARSVLEPLVPLDVRDVLETARDLVTAELDPNPLPFEGTIDSFPYGYISTENTINRYYTASYQIIVGSAEIDNPQYPVLWGGFGIPYATIPVPLWVNSREVPPQMTGSGATMCSDAQFIKGQIHDLPDIRLFNTQTAYRIHEFLSPVEENVFGQYYGYMSLWAKFGVSEDTLAYIQQDLCNQVAGRYEEVRGLFVEEHNYVKIQNISIKSYPNPFNSAVKIEISSPKNNFKHIEILDIKGKKVFETTLSPYTSTFIWKPSSKISSGLYIVSVKSGEYRATSRLILSR